MNNDTTSLITFDKGISALDICIGESRSYEIKVLRTEKGLIITSIREVLTEDDKRQIILNN